MNFAGPVKTEPNQDFPAPGSGAGQQSEAVGMERGSGGGDPFSTN